MLLITKPVFPKIVATILVRNEQDIIAQNIEHHINLGVRHFIITDNLSQDKTKEIAGRYKEVVEIIDNQDETHNQAAAVTKMARLAVRFNPDWIIHLDADELWGGLDTLAYLRHNVVASTKSYIHPTIGELFDLPRYRYFLNLDGVEEFAGPGRDTKVCHRPDPDIEILHGNHGVKGQEAFATASIYRHHFPIRGYHQFQRKVVYGHEAMVKRGSSCDRWAKWYLLWQQNKLFEVYQQISAAWASAIKGEQVQENLSKLFDFWCPEDIAKELSARIKTTKNVIGVWP